MKNLVLVVVAAAAMAMATPTLADTLITGDDLYDLINGNKIKLLNNSIVISYRSDGSFKAHTYRGTWKVVGSKVFVTFDGGKKRYDSYVRDGNGHYVLVNKYGERYPVKSIHHGLGLDLAPLKTVIGGGMSYVPRGNSVAIVHHR